MMNAMAIGLSTLTAGQRGLDVVGQNIANASTRGYHRQVLMLADRVYDGVHGVGVDIQRVARYEDQFLRRGVLASGSDASLSQVRLGLEQQTESLLTSSGFDRQLGSFFDGITRLSTRPDDQTLRRTVLASAVNLSGTLNQMSAGISQLRTDAGRAIKQTVDDINGLTEKIANLNQQIARVRITGQDPNDLLNQRDQLVQDLSEKVDIRVLPQDNDVITIIAANSPVVVGTTSMALNAAVDTSGNYVIYGADPIQPLKPQGGKLAGLLQEHNQELPAHLARLDALAVGIMQNLDQVQATGLGLNGPLSNLQGQRAVTDVNVPLDQAGLAIPPRAGQLYISVTRLSTGQRTLTAITIDPATQSLQDVANAITAGTAGQVQATVDAQNGTLNLQSSLGYTFDFAGRLPTDADNVAMNGTSVPKVTGTFTGAANDVYSFQVVGSGTVGVTPGLSLEVRDGGGTLINTLNIGDGYTPDSLLNVGNGISVKLSAGTTASGTFSARMIGQPDTAGILPALGLNTFFTGVNAATIGVRQALLDNPAALSASRSGQPGDALNLERMAALRDLKLLAGGTQTFQEHFADTLGAVGQEVQALELRLEATQSLKSNLEFQEQSVIGVDVNEEMVKLLEFQRMVETGSRYLAVANHALDSLFEMVQ